MINFDFNFPNSFELSMLSIQDPKRLELKDLYEKKISDWNIKRQDEFLAGRYCAHNAVKKLGHELISLDICPHSRRPLWPKNIIGSITHKDGMAISLVSDSIEIKGIGIDLEKMIAQEKVHQIGEKFLSKDEQALIQDGLRVEEQASIIFSFKESFFKLINPFVHEYFGFSAVEVTKVSEGNIGFKVKTEKYPFLKEFSFLNEASYSISNDFVFTWCSF